MVKGDKVKREQYGVDMGITGINIKRKAIWKDSPS